MMKEHRRLHRQVQHRPKIHHLQPFILHVCLISSPRLSMMRSMNWSSYPQEEFPGAPLPLHIMAINGAHADEIDDCNNDLVMAIAKVGPNKKSSDFVSRFIWTKL